MNGQSVDHLGEHQRLEASGLRVTRKRLALANTIFAEGPKHWTAEQVQAAAQDAGLRVSLATIYNTLNAFADAGLLRMISVDGSRTFFDTNTSDHHHFYLEDEGRLIDIDGADLRVEGLPPAPEGKGVERVDVIVRVNQTRAR